MLNEGVVLAINSKEAIVMSPDKGIVLLKKKEDMAVGKLIFFSDDQIYTRNSNLVKILSFGSAAAAIILIAFLVFFKYTPQDQIFAYVDIDINPSIELVINKDHKVIGVEAINDDAKTLAKNLDIQEKPLDTAIINVIEKSISSGYLNKENAGILFSATLAKKEEGSTSSEQIDKLLNICKDAALKTTTLKTEVKTLNTTYETIELARLASTTLGRYYIYKKLSDTGSDTSLESIKNMPVENLFIYIDKIIIKQQPLPTPIPSPSTTSKPTGITAAPTIVQVAAIITPSPSIGVTFTPVPTNRSTTLPKTYTNASTPTLKPSNSTKGIGSWKVNTQGSAKATESITNKKINIAINNKGTNKWDIALSHPIEALEVGAKYKVSFKVNALSATKIYAKIGDVGEPFREYWNNKWAPINVDANSQVVISQEFTPSGSSGNEEIVFHMGGELAEVIPNTISIDDIIITQLSGSKPRTILNYDFDDN